MTTTYTFDQLKEDVRKEAEALKIHATKEERGRLVFELLNPHNIMQCYYGLMCGNCESSRAIELIKKCAPTMLQSGNNGMQPIGRLNNIEMISYYYSPIEGYAQKPEARNENLIAYLRGETETLEL